jgi:hypothetical protein
MTSLITVNCFSETRQPKARLRRPPLIPSPLPGRSPTLHLTPIDCRYYAANFCCRELSGAEQLTAVLCALHGRGGVRGHSRPQDTGRCMVKAAMSCRIFGRDCASLSDGPFEVAGIAFGSSGSKAATGVRVCVCACRLFVFQPHPPVDHFVLWRLYNAPSAHTKRCL